MEAGLHHGQVEKVAGHAPLQQGLPDHRLVPALALELVREAVRREKETARPKAGRPKHYVFAFRPPTKAFNLKLSFNKSRASRDEVIEALETIIRDLRAQ